MWKLFNMFGKRRDRMQRELDRELQYHLDRCVTDLKNSGLSEEEARRRAAIEFGGVRQIQEEVRDTWVSRWLSDLVHDVRYATRTLARNPAFTITAVVSLALGIGANTAIFSLVDQVLVRDLPVREPERLVLLDWKGNALADGWGTSNLMSYPVCRDLMEKDAFFDGVFCRHPTMVTLSTRQEHEAVIAEIVSGSYFPVLGVRPALGRLIDQSDDRQQGAHPVVVISHDYWRNNLGSAPDVVGRNVLVNSHSMTVIGVAQAGFRGVDLGQVPALWIPTMMKAKVTPEWDRLLDRRAQWMQVFGRLKPGMTAERAKAGLEPWFKSMLDEDTKRNGFPRVTTEQRRQFLASTLDVMPSAQGHSNLRGTLDRPLSVLMAATSLLLLLACLNVAGLFVARGSARSREITTRMALGASSGRIARQVLADSLLIALGGGLLGLLAAPAISQTLISLLPREIAAIDLSSEIDHRIFLFAFLVSMLTGGLCALAPALQTGRVPLIASLSERGGSASSGSVRLRKALVTGQMAFTLILLIGAGLFVQTLARLQAKGPGFASSSLVMFRVNPARNGYSDADAKRLMRDVLTKLQDAPGVENAAVAGMPLLIGTSWNTNLTIQSEGRIVTDRGVNCNRVTEGFFSTLGTRLVRGRLFDGRDVRDPANYRFGFRSAIVNESFARRYFGDRSPIGHRLGFGNGPDTQTGIEIVGVVKDFSYRGLREETEQAFFPFWEDPTGNGTFYLKVRGNAESAITSIRAAVAQVAPTLALVSLRTVKEQVDRSLTTERMLATVSGGFGTLAVLLSAVGLYGVMSFVVTHRTRELGIRMALGASQSSAVWMILRDALAMLGAGTAIALPCVWALSRLVETQLFGVRPIDAPTIALASSFLALVALGAALLPALRASAVNPTDALRFE